jgi:hypothetical protein
MPFNIPFAYPYSSGGVERRKIHIKKKGEKTAGKET